MNKLAVQRRWRLSVLFVGSLLVCWGCPADVDDYVAKTAHFDNLPQIGPMTVRSRFYGYQSAVDRDETAGEAAYDYSVHIIKDTDAGVYRLFSGGRWLRPGVPHGDGDHVLQFISETGQAGTWKMPHDRPEFYKGSEEGYTDTWFSGNYLEPEVLKVDGTYYMYTQVGIGPGGPIDIAGEKAATSADRIQLHTSTDGLNWHRWSKERGVIVNLDRPRYTALHHQEVIYVPWDADGKPFWMYVAAAVDGTHRGHVLIRSDDPTTFDWQERQTVSGMSQIGNQVAYARQAPGGPLFVRITFTADESGRRVPCLQFSRDGLSWFASNDGPVLLDGSKNDDRNENCFFLGICTLDGTGQLERTAGNTWQAIYGATTSTTPVAPEIFFSEIGVGEVTMRIEPAAE